MTTVLESVDRLKTLRQDYHNLKVSSLIDRLSRLVGVLCAETIHVGSSTCPVHRQSTGEPATGCEEVGRAVQEGGG